MMKSNNQEINEMLSIKKEEIDFPKRFASYVEKAGFSLIEKKMYRDLNDSKEEMYHFYEITV